MTIIVNRLQKETSPYLLQHANNPVDWYPWGEEALNKAKEENKPILLSIGYSTCHWCHVMAQESFSDLATAKLMNESFINIKVDREERPDLDKIYQISHQLLTRQTGGWPLNVFLTPGNQIPFFSGTYFPPEPRHGIPAFKDVLLAIVEYFNHHRSEILQQNQQLQNIMNQLAEEQSETKISINAAPLAVARQQLAEHFDRANGGFGGAPKFPNAGNIDRLLHHCHQKTDEDRAALMMVMTTLRKMANGGIYDQLGGGFYRYTVDGEWMIPHFEKMLYDNGLLLSLYSDAYAMSNDTLLSDIMHGTGEWVIREMQSPEGGYYAALDADSDHEEGKFYYWDRDHIKKLLTADEYRAAALHFGFSNAENFGEHWHFYIAQDVHAVAEALHSDPQQIQKLLQSAKKKLFSERTKRTYPHRDQKILTGWNALMIKGMAKAGQQLQRVDFIDSAERALTFICQHLYRNKRLFASYKDHPARLMAYLDDYAFFIDALLTMLAIRFRHDDLDFAITLADSLLEYFYDPVKGGFFFTAHDHESLIHRPKSLQDDATPSGNGIAVFVLNRLGHLLGETRYLNAAEQTLKTAWPTIMATPIAYPTLLNAIEEFINPPQRIILRGEQKQLSTWQTFALKGYQPHRLSLAIADSSEKLPGPLAKYEKPEQGVTGFICVGRHCLPPVTRLAEFKNLI